MPSFLNGHNALEGLARSLPRYNVARVYRLPVSQAEIAAGRCKGLQASSRSAVAGIMLAYLYYESGGIGWVVSAELGRPPYLLQQAKITDHSAHRSVSRSMQVRVRSIEYRLLVKAMTSRPHDTQSMIA
jgi:hypothetical protein